MIKMIVLDMAGTTVDEDNIVYKTLQKVINQAGFDFSLEEVFLHGAGKEKLRAIKDIIGSSQPHDRQAKEIHLEFMEELKYAYQHHQIKAQPGAEQLFEIMKRQGVRVVLNTGFNAETAYYILKKLGWAIGREIDGVVTASDVKSNRPKPDMILKAMEQFRIDDPKVVIKVGDSVVDIQEGQNAGCLLSIGITTGAQTREEMQQANPDHIVDSLLDLLPILTKYNAVAAASS